MTFDPFVCDPQVEDLEYIPTQKDWEELYGDEDLERSQLESGFGPNS
jgi:hypothetical protein